MGAKFSSDISLHHADGDLHCNVCDGSRLRRRFSIPLVDGPYQHYTDAKRKQLYLCESCGHVMAGHYDPVGFANYYESLSADSHCTMHDTDQFRYEQILEIISKQTIRRVLDIGCGTGTFLNMLPPGVERFGIEPTSAAADVARARGVKIVQPADLLKPELQNTFDVVTAIDVLEHATDLKEFRRIFMSALSPRGMVLLLTGDVDSRSARVLGRYWYYLIGAEHVNFFSSRSMQTWLQPDFQEIELTKTSHDSPKQRWLSLIRGSITFPVKWFLKDLLGIRLNKFVALALPGDHILVRAVRKPLGTHAGINGA